MKGFNLTQSSSSLRAACEVNPLKRSAKGFSFKKASRHFHKSTSLTPRSSHDRFTSNPPTPARASAQIPESPYGDEVICISREDTDDPSTVDEISPDQLQTPSNSPYASSYTSSSFASSSSSSSCNLPPEIDDQSLNPADQALDGFDPRRESQLSMVSSWVDHHLQELDISYDQDGVYEIEIVATADGFLSRRDSFILPPGETFQSFHRKRNLPVVPSKQFSRLSRPLPSTPPSPGFNGFNLQPRPIRPLPPPPSPL